MKTMFNVTQLHFLNRFTAFLVPVLLLLSAAVFAVLIHFVLLRAGVDFSGMGPDEGAQMNFMLGWMLAGFLVYLGVSSVSMSFPFALSLGSTRRSFVAGTLFYHVGQAAYLAVLIIALIVVEKATGHWFAGIHIFDIHLLGGGDLLRAGIIAFLGTLTFLSIGAVFAAAWLRYGSRGPIFVASGIVILLAGVGLLFAPQLIEHLNNFQLWWLAVAAALIVGFSMLGQYLGLRGSSIR
ncbi:hypothetical protein [Micrococcoides hystricis]|uniref:ABC transporter permease n=1 Tax=Micrococcoides hystricis TaxID=1572761 RepID=A0ABV6PCJ1_9MICC